MQDAYPEYLHSVHYQTRTGVGQVVQIVTYHTNLVQKMKRKIIAAKEAYALYWKSGYLRKIQCASFRNGSK